MAKTEKGTLSASFEFSGMSDYWGGNGRRWDDNAGCLFASYSYDTTLREIIDQLVDDFNAGGDCDSMDESVTSDDVRNALLEMLSPQGRADYDSGAISEFATEFAAHNDPWECAADTGGIEVGDEVKIDNVNDGTAIGEIVKIIHDKDGEIRSVFVDVDGKKYRRDLADVYVRTIDEDYGEYPQVIVLLEFEPDVDGWELYQHDDGYWGWAHEDGRDVGPFSTELDAWENAPEGVERDCRAG